jgi:hypothetical protein
MVRVLAAGVRRPRPAGGGRGSRVRSAGRTGPGLEFGKRRLVGPWQPREFLVVPLERDEVLEGRDAVELGGVDEGS